MVNCLPEASASSNTFSNEISLTAFGIEKDERFLDFLKIARFRSKLFFHNSKFFEFAGFIKSPLVFQGVKVVAVPKLWKTNGKKLEFIGDVNS